VAEKLSRHILALKKEGVAGSQTFKFFRLFILPKNSLAIHQQDFLLRDLSVLCGLISV